MHDFQYGVEYPFDGLVEGVSLERTDAIDELLWAMDMREQLAAREDYQTSWFDNARVVIREGYSEADEWGPWALSDVTPEEITERGRELYGEVD